MPAVKAPRCFQDVILTPAPRGRAPCAARPFIERLELQERGGLQGSDGVVERQEQVRVEFDLRKRNTRGTWGIRLIEWGSAR